MAAHHDRWKSRPASRKAIVGTRSRGHRLSFEPLEDRRMLATITVNTLSDINNGTDGLTTLREAIAEATSGDIIDFSVSGTIQLTDTGSGHLTVDKNLTIQGPGPDLLTVKAHDPDVDGTNDSDGRRVFLVSDGNDNNLLDVVISGLTIRGGDPELDPGPTAQEHTGGGGIRNHENLTVIDSVVTDNYTINGGGLSNERQPGGLQPQLTVIDSIITGNQADDGGAMFTQRGTIVAIRTSMLNNFTRNAGGAVFNLSGNLTITDSTISGNETRNPGKLYSGKGGGVASFYGDTMITGTTISGNTAAHHGGGIFFNNSGSLTVTNSTISGNSADANGGGIHVYYYVNEPVTIAHSTITGNSAGIDGGGIFNGSTDIDILLDHTIVAGHVRGSGTGDDLDGSFDVRFSLIGNRTGSSLDDQVGNLIGTSTVPIDPMLGPLADNGGLTMTHILLPGSPALDAGDAAAMAGMGGIPEFDQRGDPFSRVADGDGMGGDRIDMGAVEIAPPPAGPDLPGDYSLNGVVDAADYVVWRRSLGASVPRFSGADGNGDETVDDNDYGVWSGNFGETLPAAGGAAASVESTASADAPSDSGAGLMGPTKMSATLSDRVLEGPQGAADGATSSRMLLLAVETGTSQRDGSPQEDLDAAQGAASETDSALAALYEEGDTLGIRWPGL